MRNIVIVLALLGSSVWLMSFTQGADNSVPATPISASSPATAQIAQEELIHRQAELIQARVWIDEGCRLASAGNSNAVAKLEAAIKLLPGRARATESDYQRAYHALSDAYTHEGENAIKAKDNKKALECAKKALELAPENHAAEFLIVQVRQTEREADRALQHPPEPTPLNKTPEFLDKRAQIKKLFREGKILLNSGQFDEAEQRFQQIIVIDPYNADAQEMIKTVYDAKTPSARTGEEAARKKMMWQADNAWLIPMNGEVKRPEAETSSTRLQSSSLNQTILKKLNEIKFPEIKFRDAALADVVTWLSEESRKLDEPTHEGVNIILGPGVSSAESAPAPVGEGAAPAPAASAAATPGRSITISMRNIPMIDALKYITPLAQLKYRIESSAVLLLPPDAPEQQLVTRPYPVTPGVFSKFVSGGTGAAEGGGGAGGGGAVEKLGAGTGTSVTTVDLKKVFADAGVPFPPGSSITYNDRTSTIIINNTPENIEAFEKVLPSFDAQPSQVEIEAKFIEINQTDLDALGFQWGAAKIGLGANHQYGIIGGTGTLTGMNPGGTPPPGSTIANSLRDIGSLQGDPIQNLLQQGSAATAYSPQLMALSGIMSSFQLSMVMQALSQKTSTDLLSAPKITVVSGQAGTLKVVQEFIYPGEYTEPQASTSGGAVTPTVPSSFKMREVGVVLNVTPTVGADKYTIDLALNPEITEFLGFLDYSPGNVSSVDTNGSTNSTPYKIVQPLFSSRNITTRVNIWDGQTVVLGGLIKENVQVINDKVPILGDLPIVGRLFRSKSTNRSKSNLLIFVTVRLIGPDGNPIHREISHSGIR